jgi:hypothetical protein
MRLRIRPDRPNSPNSAVAPHASRPTLIAARALYFLCCAALTAAAASAQPGPTPTPRTVEPDAAPPPMMFIPSELRARLAAEKDDMKDRTKLSVQLANERLASAEAHTQAENYDAAGIDFGIYQALITDAVKFIKQTGRRDNKARDNFKRIELALREHTPRIEKIRRQTPARSAVHVKAALDFVRQSRTDALESFYGDTVLREPPPAPEQQEKKP